MSKTALKKELQNLDARQLRELIIDSYDAVKEVRPYFDFFVNPDVAKLYEKHQQALRKEFRRVSHGRSKARISNIRSILKDFQIYNPGTDYILRLWEIAIREGLYSVHFYWCTEALRRGVFKLVADYITFADRNMMLDAALTALGDMPERNLSRINSILNQTVAGALDSIASTPLSPSDTTWDVRTIPLRNNRKC